MTISLFGHILLLIALFTAIMQGILPLWGYRQNNPYLLAAARPLALLQFTFVASAFFLLAAAFALNDFSLVYVAAQSHPSLPLAYRLTAVWGGHEGSILLWMFTLSGWAFLFSCQNNRTALLPLTLAILGWLCACFLVFLYLTSDPFLSTDTQLDGNDLNPLLQDPGFIIHPPFLFAGYTGFALPFSITLAALLLNRLDQTWVYWTRQWTLAAWCCLTIGITLGSWWAYRVLGWGGFWFWDPVENASLLPWLTGVALIHALLLTEKRKLARGWSCFLALITFGFSLLGTFLVRSGMLISAHTFATDPRRGAFLLLLWSSIFIPAFILYARRMSSLSHSSSTMQPSWWSREMGLLLNSALFFIAMLIILLGTLYPLILDVLQANPISVGAPYFNTVMLPLALLILCSLMIWPLYPWGEVRSFKTGFQAALRTFHQQSLRLSMALSHGGFVVLLAGILLSSLFSQEREVRLKIGEATALGPYLFQFLTIQTVEGVNYQGIQGDFSITKNGQFITHLHPQKRIYNVRNMVMTKVDIHPGLLRDLYLALGEPLGLNEWSLRLYYKPFIRWIWLGGLLMAAGGGLAWIQRKMAGKQHENI